MSVCPARDEPQTAPQKPSNTHHLYSFSFSARPAEQESLTEGTDADSGVSSASVTGSPVNVLIPLIFQTLKIIRTLRRHRRSVSWNNCLPQQSGPSHLLHLCCKNSSSHILFFPASRTLQSTILCASTCIELWSLHLFLLRSSSVCIHSFHVRTVCHKVSLHYFLL